MPLPASFYDREVTEVARQLLGKRLVRAHPEGLVSGWIVETEAYLAENDRASHAFRGLTGRNRSMFGAAGHAYVYSIHSRFCLNAVTQPQGVASAVLIRAVEPQAGIELMQQRRGRQKLRELTRGPARLCQAFAVDRQLDGWDLTRGEQLWIWEDPNFDLATASMSVSPRIGVTSARDLLLRFFLAGNAYVSK